MNALAHFELVLPFTLWRRAFMPLLANPNVVATGTLVRDPGRQPTGLLLDQLTVSERPLGGPDYAPLADWIAVAVPWGSLPDHPEAWLRRLEPCFAQLLVILLLGRGRERGSWRGWAIERGVIHPLAGLRLVGPGMVHTQAAQAAAVVPEADSTRFTRLRGAVGADVLAKLRAAGVALVGCSRSGTLAAGMFASLGVRRLVLIDGDRIEPHNLDGMILAAEADVGSNKAVALGRRLVEFRSDLLVQALPRPLSDRAAEAALGGVDLIVTCVDQDGARLRAAHWARERLTPHLDIGAGVTQTGDGERQLAADVRLLLPTAGCLRCVGGLSDLDQAEYELHAPPGALPRRPPEAWNARGRLGSLITMNSMAVSLGVQSWLDLLGGDSAGSIWHRLRWRPGTGLEVNSGLVTAGENCPLCGVERSSRRDVNARA